MNFDVENFSNNGFAIIRRIFSKGESDILFSFTKDWIWGNIVNSVSMGIGENLKDKFDLINYKDFIKTNCIDHNKVASAKYRYRTPNQNIEKILRSKKIMDLVSRVSNNSEFITWQDPGFGWLGYRLIRPDTKDGYPPSCKNWGAAAGVFSLWLPIIGCNENSSIRFLKGSHLKEYKKYLPKITKFTKGEYRLSEDIKNSSFIRLNCQIGDAIIYHPATIHSEDSFDKKITRVNLEYRFMPTNL